MATQQRSLGEKDRLIRYGGGVVQGIESMIPLCWNKKAQVVRYESYVAQTRAVAVVETASQNAYDDNSANNTLLKAVSSSRSGAVVHEHKRHLKDGRVITVRNSFTRPHWRCSPTAAAGVLPADRLPQRGAVRRDAV